jgi:hypothetical protein
MTTPRHQPPIDCNYGRTNGGAKTSCGRRKTPFICNGKHSDRPAVVRLPPGKRSRWSVLRGRAQVRARRLIRCGTRAQAFLHFPLDLLWKPESDFRASFSSRARNPTPTSRNESLLLRATNTWRRLLQRQKRHFASRHCNARRDFRTFPLRLAPLAKRAELPRRLCMYCSGQSHLR